LSDQDAKPPLRPWGSAEAPTPIRLGTNLAPPLSREGTPTGELRSAGSPTAAPAALPTSVPTSAPTPALGPSAAGSHPTPVESPIGEQGGEPARATRRRPVAASSSQGLPDEEEPFDVPGTEKLGIIGGNRTGKSFLFQAMVDRTLAGTQSGAMSHYLEGTWLFQAVQREDGADSLHPDIFGKRYKMWQRLPSNLLSNQRWYRLRLFYRTGILGRARSAMDIEYFDGSGEGFFQADQTAGTWKMWQQGYLDARVMVFCLPLWAAFPAAGLSREDWKTRSRLLEGFDRVVKNYVDLRRRNQRNRPVKSILALTMADDKRTALTRLRDRWITPYIGDSRHTYLHQLQSGAGIARYLANARSISESLHQEFAASPDRGVVAIPQFLNFGQRPWLIPLSAVDGARLDEIEQKYPDPDDRPPLKAPEPVHVELPLLVALCERVNALM
jgi:hypothetical protein